MKQKELIEYKVVDVDVIVRENQLTEPIDADTPFSEAIELRGGNEHALALAHAFLWWRKRTREIVYRPSAQAKALIIFSLFDEERFFHAPDVLGPVRFSDEQLEAFARLQENDAREEIVIDLELLYKQTSGLSSELSAFLLQLYAINPKKKSVRLQGSLPAFALLLVLDWFAGKTEEIVYHDETLL